NVRDLMLRPEVVAACQAKRFAVYAIDRVEQGIELVTGRAAGFVAAGRFRPKSVYALAFARAPPYAVGVPVFVPPHAAESGAPRRLALAARRAEADETGGAMDAP